MLLDAIHRTCLRECSLHKWAINDLRNLLNPAVPWQRLKTKYEIIKYRPMYRHFFLEKCTGTFDEDSETCPLFLSTRPQISFLKVKWINAIVSPHPEGQPPPWRSAPILKVSHQLPASASTHSRNCFLNFSATRSRRHCAAFPTDLIIIVLKLSVSQTTPDFSKDF